MQRVFVSSTVFDLIDARREIEEQLREIGLTPVLSDGTVSDFRVQPDRNSIESCLVNVANSEFVVVILCRRYGPSLKSAGFPDVPATHLEIDEARRTGRPLFVYVRDRLEADYRLWRKNHRQPDLKFCWVDEKDVRLLELVDSFQRLSASNSKNNFYSVFRDTIELKSLIRRDLRLPAGKANLAALIERNETPLLKVSVAFIENPRFFRIEVTNVGRSPAFNVVLGVC